MKFTKEESFKKSKHGINLSVYETKTDDFGFVEIETEEGHFQEFSDKKSYFIYYILEGEGTFYLNGEATPAKPTDLIVIPPNTNIYYIGKLKMTLTTIPGWQPENEVHVRNIQKEDK